MANAVTLEILDAKIKKAITDLAEIIGQFAQNIHAELTVIKRDVAEFKEGQLGF